MADDYYSALRDRLRDEKLKRQQEHGERVKEWCIEKGIAFSFIQPYQVIIVTPELSMDIYLQSRKYHNITLNKRGHIDKSIKGFLSSVFKK